MFCYFLFLSLLTKIRLFGLQTVYFHDLQYHIRFFLNRNMYIFNMSFVSHVDSFVFILMDGRYLRSQEGTKIYLVTRGCVVYSMFWILFEERSMFYYKKIYRQLKCGSLSQKFRKWFLA